MRLAALVLLVAACESTPKPHDAPPVCVAENTPCMLGSAACCAGLTCSTIHGSSLCSSCVADGSACDPAHPCCNYCIGAACGACIPRGSPCNVDAQVPCCAGTCNGTTCN